MKKSALFRQFMKKAKVIPPVRTFVPDVPPGGRELGFLLAVLWAMLTFTLFFGLRASSFGSELSWEAFLASAILQAVFGLMPILYAAALMRWRARVGLIYCLGLIVLPIVLPELYFLPEEKAFREQVLQTSPTELTVRRGAPFSFATMTYDDEYGYWGYGWLD